MDILVYASIYAGSGLMVYNIVRCAGFVRRMQSLRDWGGRQPLLYIPLVLLNLFLVGYLSVGFLASPTS